MPRLCSPGTAVPVLCPCKTGRFYMAVYRIFLYAVRMIRFAILAFTLALVSSACGTDGDSSPNGTFASDDLLAPGENGANEGEGASGAQEGAPDLPRTSGAGYTLNQISLNWTLQDGDGNKVNLYDYSGKVIFFEDGSEW